MRVTQTMLAQNSLRHLSQSYDQLGRLQDQLSTGKKITRASQDPVAAMNGMRYRSQSAEVQQFQRNSGEVYNWMESSDDALDKATQALHRVRELATQAANDSYDENQRANIAKEVSQLYEHLVSMANTKSNDKYIFNGADTTNPPVDQDGLDLSLSSIEDLPNDEKEQHSIAFRGNVYRYEETDGDEVTFKNEHNHTTITIDFAGDEAAVSHKSEGDTTELRDRDVVLARNDAVSADKKDVEMELLQGVTIPVNANAENVFSSALFGDVKRLEKALEDPEADGEELTTFIDTIDQHVDNMVNERAEMGARLNRVEMIEERLGSQEVIAERIMSENEDADMEKVITDLMSQENVHRAALGAGARIIQPTLMDFLR
ncbi:flagellar hook-associated protein 3 FlgL [Alteribacillus persepolensis]|uniref:Flagellar hook-associated protein 3 FlgL n=1 Tax=Alteribacillus persepolensis TaxID=568899 RepID=A0A1G8AF85_9BACI|nr:flagellar hook-associated protein FlgL [Alteribacillus persepolensis]SDH19537.1 flagellar hook-associated protein 3 FlgL [Alteribacillus persepolensis]